MNAPCHVNQVITDQKTNISYRVVSLLGKGGFASVYDVVTTKPLPPYNQVVHYACKVTPKERLQKRKLNDKFQQEIKIHRSLSFQYICKLYTVFKDNSNYYMLLELCDTTSLSHLFKKRNGLTEEEIQRIAYELLTSLEYLEKMNIVHRDIKSSNVFLKRQKGIVETKLGDFGLSAYIIPGQPRFTLCGTPNFISAEILCSHIARRLAAQVQCDPNIDQQCQDLYQKLPMEFQMGHSYPTDIWSTGCLLYQLAFAKAPFESSSITQTYVRILKGQYSFPTKNSKRFSTYFYKFVERMLVLQPSKRATVKQLLADPWIAGGKTVKLNSLPEQVENADFNASYFASQPMQKFLNYRGSIQDQCKKWETDHANDQNQYIQQMFGQGQQGQAGGALQTVGSGIQGGLNGLQGTANGIQGGFQNTVQQNAALTNDFLFSESNVPLQPQIQPISLLQYLQQHYTTFQVNTSQLATPDLLQIPPQLLAQYYITNVLPDPKTDRFIVPAFDLCGFIAHFYNFMFPRFHQLTYALAWMDYTERYGFIYQMSSGAIGALFNDQSVIIASPNKIYVDYFDNNGIARRTLYANRQLLCGEKKAKLLEYFIDMLENRTIAPLTAEMRENTDQMFFQADMMRKMYQGAKASTQTSAQGLQSTQNGQYAGVTSGYNGQYTPAVANNGIGGQLGQFTINNTQSTQFTTSNAQNTQYASSNAIYDISKVNTAYIHQLARSFIEDMMKKFSDNNIQYQQLFSFQDVEKQLYDQIYQQATQVQPCLKCFKNTVPTISMMFTTGMFQNNNNTFHIKIIINMKNVILVNEVRQMIAYKNEVVVKKEFTDSQLGAYINGLIQNVTQFYNELGGGQGTINNV